MKGGSTPHGGTREDSQEITKNKTKMEIEGIIIKDLGVRTGTSQRGEPWKMATYVIETIEPYPKRIVFDVSDGTQGRIERLGIKEGMRMRVFFDIHAREHNGRWYNSVQAFDARPME